MIRFAILICVFNTIVEKLFKIGHQASIDIKHRPPVKISCLKFIILKN